MFSFLGQETKTMSVLIVPLAMSVTVYLGTHKGGTEGAPPLVNGLPGGYR